MTLINDKSYQGRRLSTRILLACGVAVPVLFVGVTLLEGAVRPNYEWLHRFGSELAWGARGWVMITNFVVAGLLILGFATGLRRVLGGGRGATAAPVLASLLGMCLIVSGVFVTDPKPGNPEGLAAPAEPTLSGMIHDANPLPFYLTLLALMVVFARRFAVDGGGRVWAWSSVACAVAVVLTFGIAANLYDPDPDSGTGDFHGLWQRINLSLGLGWIAAVAVRYLRVHSRAETTPERTANARASSTAGRRPTGVRSNSTAPSPLNGPTL